MKSSMALFFAVVLCVLTSSLLAQTQPPEITDFSTNQNIREADLANLFVRATDPDTADADLLYTWTITSDPTGQAFFRLTDGSDAVTVTGTSGARVGLREGANYPNPTYLDDVIMGRVEVSDGVNPPVGADIPITVVGVNQRPVLTVDTAQLGTAANPRMTNQGLGLDARASVDPDGNEIKVLWTIAGISGGQSCSAALVLFGKETLTPGMTVPQVSALPSNPMTITIEAFVEDGLINFSQTFTGYMASTNGCASSSPSPVVNGLTATPSIAAYGQQVTLQASAPNGLNYSWVQLDTTGTGNAVNLTGANTRTATFVAPSITTTLRFQFTVSDTQNRSDSQTISVQITPSGSGGGGGGTGGGGGGGGGGGTGGSSGTPSGTATGQAVCNQTNNSPAVATVPAQFTIEGGNTAIIRATNARDPDNTQVFVNGIVTSGVSYQWTLVDGGGVINSGALSNTSDASVRVATPSVPQNTTATLAVTINDAANCGTSYQVQLVMTPAQNQTNNVPPDARLLFQLDGQSQDEANGQSVTLTSPAQVTLDARSSVDSDGTVSFNFNMVQNLSRGGAVLSTVSDGVQRLDIQPDTEGTIQVTLTVTDDKGASDSVTITFVIEDIAAIPVAAGAVMVNGLALEPGEPVEEGSVVTLDGSDSALPDGSQPGTLTYSWRQVSGPPVNIVDADKPQAQFRAPEVLSGSTPLEFELVVRNGNASSTPARLGVTVQVPPLFFSQVAFGPLVDERFRTVVVLINNNDFDAENITIEFFDPEGQPLSVFRDGEPWDSSQPFSITASSSEMLRFGAPDDTLTVGWARVNSESRLTGLVLYQLIDSMTGDLNSEVSLFASRRGSRFTTFYSPADGLAAAIANPGTTEAKVNIKIIDPALGPDLPLATRPVILPPGTHLARFLNESYFGILPSDFEAGTLVIETVQGRVISTVLKTKGGVAISTLPLAVRR